jgi:hypothetical protein
MPSFRRCGMCAINWPPGRKYDRCPKCDTPTAVRNDDAPSPILSDAEADSIVAHVKFEEYLESETEEERMDRQRRYEQEREDAEFPDNRAAFRAVIAGAGFQAWEIEMIGELEAQLPSAHLRPD